MQNSVLQHLILFLCDGIGGYYLQSLGCLIMICALNQVKLKPLTFIGMSVLFGVLTFGIRSIPIISTGFHTMLSITAYIFLSIYLIKTKIYPTVFGALSATILILFCEVIVVGIFALFYNTTVLTSDGTIQGDIRKAIYGIPVNILLIIISFIVYKIRLKSKEKADSGNLSK